MNNSMNSFSTPSKFRFIQPGFGNIELRPLTPPGPGSSPLAPRLGTANVIFPPRPARQTSIPGSEESDESSPSSSRAASPLAPGNTGSETAQACQCERPSGIIMCCSCGHILKGRIRKSCPYHPNSIYLMDIDTCPECSSERLREYKPASP